MRKTYKTKKPVKVIQPNIAVYQNKISGGRKSLELYTNTSKGPRRIALGLYLKAETTDADVTYNATLCDIADKIAAEQLERLRNGHRFKSKKSKGDVKLVLDYYRRLGDSGQDKKERNVLAENFKYCVRCRAQAPTILNEGKRRVFLDIYWRGKKLVHMLDLYLVPENTSEAIEQNNQTRIEAERIAMICVMEVLDKESGRPTGGKHRKYYVTSKSTVKKHSTETNGSVSSEIRIRKRGDRLASVYRSKSLKDNKVGLYVSVMVEGKRKKRWTHLSLTAVHSSYDQEQNEDKERVAQAIADMVDYDLRQGRPFVPERNASLSLALDYYNRFCNSSEHEWAKRIIADAYRNIVKIEYRWRPDGIGKITLRYDKDYSKTRQHTLNMILLPETTEDNIRANRKVNSLVEEIQLTEVIHLLDNRFGFNDKVKGEDINRCNSVDDSISIPNSKIELKKEHPLTPSTMSRDEYINKKVWRMGLTVTPREKNLSNGFANIYLDIYRHGRRKREYLNLLLRPEKNLDDVQYNSHIRRVAQEIANRVTIQIVNDTFIYGKDGKEPLVLTYYRELSGRYDGEELRHIIASAYDDHTKIRFKTLANGRKAVVMDVFANGQRTKKSFGLYCQEGSSKGVIRQNEEILKKAEMMRLRFNELYLDHLVGILKMEKADELNLATLTDKLMQMIKDEQGREHASLPEITLSQLPAKDAKLFKSDVNPSAVSDQDESYGVDWEKRMRDAVNMIGEKMNEIFNS